VPVLVEENLGRVVCPVCGTEYDDSASACPKCGAMGIASKKALIKGEGRPVPLRVSEPAAPPPPRMTPLGLAPAQGGYPPQGLIPNKTVIESLPRRITPVGS